MTDPAERDEAASAASESTLETSASETSHPNSEPETSSADTTGQGDEVSPEQTQIDGPTAAAEDAGAEALSSDAAADGASSEGAPGESAEGDLPEWEPLTPELVEDEAIRGDFMLRWAVVLLALLLGCREITETSSLVRIKTGEYLASHGFLPPANDVFSYTATERPWVNTAWLFDLIVGGVYGIGGAVAVSLLTAVMAAVILYFVVHITRPELPTWWTAFCAGATLFVLQTEFTALPELVTLLGVAWTLRGLVHWSQTGKRSALWCLVGSLAVWGNLDPRAFIGWILIAAYALGTVLSDRFGRRTHHETACLRDLGLATVAGFVALLINPFGWHTITAPVSLYTVQLPALVEYLGSGELLNYPLYFKGLWQPLAIPIAVGVGVLVLAVLTSLLNFRRLDLGLLVACLTVGGLAVVCSHELIVAALIGTVLVSLNGQDWYRDNCRVEYSTNTLELLWSRLGRAMTVLALAAFAWLAVSGRLMGPDGKRIGVGFSPQLATNIAGLEQDLAAIEADSDAHIFVTNLHHGDLLVWLDRPTFVDSRVEVYAGGEDDILRLHNQARYALRTASPTADASAIGGTADSRNASSADDASGNDDDPESWFGRRELWAETFDRFDVRLVTPRLWGRTPDVFTWVDLERSADWTLTSIGATSAFYVRKPGEEGTAAAPENTPQRVDFVQAALRDCQMPKVTVERIDWPRPRTGYQNFMSLPARPVSVAALRAQRLSDWLSLGINGAVPMTADEAYALATLSLRNAAAALDDNVNNAEAFFLQAQVYQTLGSLEAASLNSFGLPIVNEQRHLQRMHALHQALVLQPDNLSLTSTLGDEYLQRQRWDLAREYVTRSLDLIRRMDDPDDQDLALAQRLSQLKKELDPRIENIYGQVNEALVAPEPEIRGLILGLVQQGYPQRALELFEEHRLSFAGDLLIELQGAFLFAECGRLADAETQFATFEAIPDDPTVTFQWVLQSAWLKMAKGEYENAIALCQRRLRDIERSTANALLSLSGFVQPIPGLLADRQIWPATLTSASMRALYETREETTQLRWTITAAMIEAGLCSDAASLLRELLDADPETRVRPLVRQWLHLLTGETIPELPESQTVPILIEDGPEEPVDASEATEKPRTDDSRQQK
ncbi:hypothetical protein GC176_20640 [bacterium]|nr:hypothetical protein [bacterium]